MAIRLAREVQSPWKWVATMLVLAPTSSSSSSIPPPGDNLHIWHKKTRATGRIWPDDPVSTNFVTLDSRGRARGRACIFDKLSMFPLSLLPFSHTNNISFIFSLPFLVDTVSSGWSHTIQQARPPLRSGVSECGRTRIRRMPFILSDNRARTIFLDTTVYACDKRFGPNDLATGELAIGRFLSCCFLGNTR